ncbi:XLF-domain-containing protein [Myriangium duriaei CBS 260.36]|uniref:Non-homologous end-joining factor 1 n=1 Tax=Myriangium duriaei CBS 260.36 TaxID=1168546 RepID=A0A9P4IXD9_9PEZI|nr:XLF-domain-containing protein [Myriangium duriaei CBS 260.36]
MTITAPWRVLQTPKGRGQIFLIKYEFHDAGHEIYLTDLSRLWSEQLQYEEIIRKAKENGSAIDPGENAQQREQLFRKIASALEGDRGTSLTIKPREIDDTIVLELISPLPAGLSDLHWKIVLHEKEPGVYREHLAGPLLEGLHRKELDINHLHQTIKEKDHVISRLLDRLESSGTDLTTVFSGTANVKMSRKASQRGQLGRYVRGLEPFNASAWISSTASIDKPGEMTSVLMDIVPLDNDSFIRQLGFGDSTTERATPVTQTQIKQEAHQEQRMPQRDDDTASDTETEDENDFQVQQIPEKGRLNGGLPQYSRAVSAANDDLHSPLGQVKDESLNLPQESPSPPASKHGPSPTRSPSKSKVRLGMIGGAKSMARSESITTEDAPSPPPDSTQQASITKTISPRKPKLGMVGGRKGTSSASTSNPAEDEAHQSRMPKEDLAATKDQSMQLRHRSPKSEAGSQVRDTDTTVEVQKPKESSEDRADRRRDELKRQLASQPAGAKKKRKF